MNTALHPIFADILSDFVSDTRADEVDEEIEAIWSDPSRIDDILGDAGMTVSDETSRMIVKARAAIESQRTLAPEFWIALAAGLIDGLEVAVYTAAEHEVSRRAG